MSNLQDLFEKLKKQREAKEEKSAAGGSYLIVGLGNPGKDYVETRHNVGFMVVDQIAKKLGVTFSRVEQRALVEKVSYQGHRIILVKPQTFMNNSGEAVGGLVKFYKIPQQNILIIYDDVDLEFEKLRLRAQGSSGGQKGMKSIIQHLGTEEFARMRIGLDRPPGKMPTPSYVLQEFSAQQKEALSMVLDKAAEAALKFVTDGVVTAMNEYNGNL